MRWFSHRRSPSPPGGRAMVLSVAACCVWPTAHAVLCIVNGDDSPLFRFLSLVTLTFDLGFRNWARFLYSAPNCQVSSSYVQSFGSYLADKQTSTHTLTNKQIVKRQKFKIEVLLNILGRSWQVVSKYSFGSPES